MPTLQRRTRHPAPPALLALLALLSLPSVSFVGCRPDDRAPTKAPGAGAPLLPNVRGPSQAAPPLPGDRGL